MVQVPHPFSQIPRHQLLYTHPSPIQPLPRITSALNPSIPIYAKREDSNSGLACGGNKVRKLEYLVADALAQNATTLISIGGVQSNHTRAVAASAAATGLKCATVQEKWVDYPNPNYDKVGNIQLSRLMGSDVRMGAAGFGIEHKDSLAKLREELEGKGEKVYYIPAGASDHSLGGLGFARWAFEVAEQEEEMGVFFDTVIVCAVTGSTFAGMVAGFKLLEKNGGRKRRVVGIDASAKPKETFDQVLRIARFTAVKIGMCEQDITKDDVELDDRYHAGVYGIADETTMEAIRFGAKTEAFITDPVYEGKSLAGMMDMIRKGEIKEGSHVLYAHLGGQEAINAYTDL